MGDDNVPSNEEIINFSLFAHCELVKFKEASNNQHWRKAMDEEIHVNEKNPTWKLIDLATNKRLIGAN